MHLLDIRQIQLNTSERIQPRTYHSSWPVFAGIHAGNMTK